MTREESFRIALARIQPVGLMKQALVGKLLGKVMRPVNNAIQGVIRPFATRALGQRVGAKAAENVTVGSLATGGVITAATSGMENTSKARQIAGMTPTIGGA